MIKYICECGKEFDNPQKFNGHKSNCRIHYQIKYGTDDKFREKYVKSAKKLHRIQCEKQKIRANTKIQKWIAEKHVCERCGKLMTEKYGSGRFCSEACAKIRTHSIDNRKQISNKLKLHYNSFSFKPMKCLICGNDIPFELRHRKTCSSKCLREYKKLHMIGNSYGKGNNGGGFRENSVKRYKYGTYKGIKCDSSFELAFLVYNLDHDIPIYRNNNSFNYFYKGKEHKYYPDFLVQDTYYELKNYWTDVVQAKIDAFPKNLNYVILYPKDIQKYLSYCIKTYGKDFCEKLYDKSLPSYLDNKTEKISQSS